MSLIGKNRRGVKPYSFVARLAGTLALPLVAAGAAFTFSAQAADRYWNVTKVGGSEDSPYDIWATANWDGAVGSGNQLHFAVSQRTYIKSTSNTQVGNDFDVDSGDFVFLGPLYFLCYKSNQANATSSVVKKGEWTIKDYGMRIGSGSGTTVTFTNESGNVSITGGRNNDSILSVASGANSTVTVVKEAGDWSVSKTFFIGNGAGSTGRFYNRGGNVSGNSLYGVCLGSGAGDARDAYLEISGGRISNTGGHLCIGDGDNPGTSTVYVTGNGEYLAQAGYVIVGSRGASTLTIDQNGLVTASANGVNFCNAAACVAGRDCFLNLNGGTLATKTVTYGSGGAAATFTFNGGTLKALQAGTLIAAHNNFTVNVGSGGAMLDTDGYAVTIAEPLNAVSGTTGGLTVTGGGMATFSAMGDLTGAFAVGADTTLHYFDQDGAVANYAISSISLAPGSTIYLDADVTGCDTFGAATTNITATSASKATIYLLFTSAVPAGTTYTLFDTVDGSEFDVIPMIGAVELPHEVSAVNGKLTLTITAEDYTWNGTQTNWGDADAWTKGGASATWSPGNNAIFSTANAEAVLAADASASEVRFTADATVSGASALSVSKIDVASGVTATISAPFGSATEKTGAGTLVLTQNPANTLTLVGGTLSMNGETFDGTPVFTVDTDATLANGTYGTAGGAFVLPYGTLRFASDAILTNQASVTVGSTADATASLTKNGGTLTTSADFFVATGENSEAEFVNTAGDWTVSRIIYIGRNASSTGRVVHAGGTLTAKQYLSVGSYGVGYLTIEGGEVKNTGYDLTIGDLSVGTAIIKTGGKYSNSSYYSGLSTGLRVGCIGDGTLIVQGGEVYLGTNAGALGMCMSSGYDSSGTVTITDGGIVTVPQIKHGAGAGTAILTVNNGTIKAFTDNASFMPAHDNLFVYVGAGGAAFDANGHTITIGEPLLEDAESAGGGMTFKGGGKITLVAGNTYTGATTVEVGTTVYIPAPGAILGGVAVTVPETAPADGVYSLLSITGTGTFPASVLTGVVAPTGSRLVLSSDSKSVLCVYGNPDPAWIGGASGSLSVGANWSTGVVPTSGNCFIGNATTANLTVGDTFAATSITFPADTALVTIGGADTISGIVAITNLAALHHVFNCPVMCADGITPSITRASGNYMTFAGGIAMYNAPKTGGSVNDYWSGSVTVTTDDMQSYTSSGNKNYVCFVPGTTYSAKLGCFDRAFIDAGATVSVDNLVYNGCARSATANNKTGWYSLVFDNGNGVLRTKEVKTISDAVLFHSYAGADMVGGTIIAEKLTCATTKQTGGSFPYPVFMLNCGGVSGSTVATDSFNGEGVWVIGPGGLAFGETIHSRSHFETSIGKSLGGRPAATLHSYADWTLHANPNGRNAVALQIGSNNGGFLAIDTSHYAIGDAAYDSATSHTVTLDGKVTSGPMRVEGNGKVVFANEYNTFSGLTVTNTATASVKAGCKPGEGAVTLAAGTTLEVAESGTASVSNLTLAAGATLAFNFTDKRTAPVLAATSATLPTTVNVKVSSTNGLRAKGGRYALTSGGVFTGANVTLAPGYPDWVKGVSIVDDEIVLDVKSRGTFIIVR